MRDVMTRPKGMESTKMGNAMTPVPTEMVLPAITEKTAMEAGRRTTAPRTVKEWSRVIGLPMKGAEGIAAKEIPSPV